MTLVTQSDYSKGLDDIEKFQRVCNGLMKTKHFQKLGEEGVYSILATAQSLGIHPMLALSKGFTCIQGKVGMTTEMMAALVRQRGHSIMKDPKSNGEICILHGKRADNGDTWTCTFSKEDAVSAGLWGTATWKKYPAVMLYNRCMSMLFRQLFADLSLGSGYVEDELREITKSGEYGTDNVKPLYMAEAEESVISTISFDEALLLEELLKDTPKEYQEKMNDWLKKRGYIRLTDMPKDVFDEVITKLKIKVAAIKQMAAISEENLEVVNE